MSTRNATSQRGRTCCGAGWSRPAPPSSPLTWVGEAGWHSRFGIALRAVELGLNQKDGPGEVSAPEVGASQVGADDVGHPQVGTSQVSSDEVCPSETGTPQVGLFEIGPDEVGAPVVLRVPEAGSRQLAC